MPLHVVITRLNGAGQTASVNVTEEWIRERIVMPWERGEDIVLSGLHRAPREVKIAIYQGDEVPEPAEPRILAAMIGQSANRTDDFLRRPAGTASAVADREFADDRRAVMVIHGRNGVARKAMFDLLRAINLRPLEWTSLVGLASAATPYIGDILDEAFATAQAAVVLFTPDDMACLRPEFIPEGDPEREAELRGQARPNVFYEAGMAMGRFPARTVLTELGVLRAASDLAGRHAVRLTQGPECRKDLAQRLEKAGCDVDISGSDWLTAGEFGPPPSGSVAAGQAVAPEHPLIPRIDALIDDLRDQDGFVLTGVADIYNAIVTESAADWMPLAQPQTMTRAMSATGVPKRSKMTGNELRTMLNQLRTRL